MKASVVLSDFYEPGFYQPGLFDDTTTRPDSKALMSVVDRINHSGKGKVFFGSQGLQHAWV